MKTEGLEHEIGRLDQWTWNRDLSDRVSMDAAQIVLRAIDEEISEGRQFLMNDDDGNIVMYFPILGEYGVHIPFMPLLENAMDKESKATGSIVRGMIGDARDEQERAELRAFAASLSEIAAKIIASCDAEEMA